MKKIICLTGLVETSPQALPLGAACIASAVKNSSRTKDILSVQLKDFSLETGNFSKEEFVSSLDDEVFAVLFSVYVWNRSSLDELAGLIKKAGKNIFLIAGGPEVTANPFNFNSFDYTVCGEGEEAVVLLLEALIKGEEPEIQGVFSLKNKKHNCIAVRTKAPSPETLSSPYLDGTLDPSLYGGALWELARGCPFKCTYCYESKGEKKIQYFPMERLTRELELFARKKIPQVFVLDPTYNASKKRALEMIKLIRSKAPGMFFYFEARAEYIDRELARAFASIPCCLQFGLQSAHEQVLKLVNRTVDKKLISRNVSYLNQEGAVFGFDLIYGLPGDNLQGFKSSIDYALSLYPNNLELFCLSVLPGTVLAEDAAGLGLEYEKEAPYHVIKNRTYSPDDLRKSEMISKACNLFYNRGRAVPWFLSVLYPLHMKPSAFFADFAEKINELNEGEIYKLPFEKIVEFQKDFISEKYKEKHLEKLLLPVLDIITLNGALSEVTASAKESIVQLKFHPDDLMSEYAQDINFLCKNIRSFSNRTKVFPSKNGPDWKVLKSH